MKNILLLAAFASLLTTTGCIVADDRGPRREYRHHDEVIVPAPVVIEPEVRVR